jgi:hypothetical protein
VGWEAPALCHQNRYSILSRKKRKILSSILCTISVIYILVTCPDIGIWMKYLNGGSDAVMLLLKNCLGSP